MKNKNIWRYLLIVLIIITLIIIVIFFSIKHANVVFQPYLFFKEKWNSMEEETTCTPSNCRDGIILGDKIYRGYNDFIDASITELINHHINYYKFYYDYSADSFFSENKAYKKVSEENMDEVYDYFEAVYNDYYDTRVFPEGFSLKEVISENDYYYILDEFYENKKIYRPYEEFEFYYYDAEEHVLYWLDNL